MKLNKALSEIEAIRVLDGKVTEVQKELDSATVLLETYGTVAEVPIAYLCQDPEVEAYWAFAVDDQVLVEWNVPVVESPTPTKDSCRVIGFSDGVPRLCIPRYVLVALRYKYFVAFYNCESGSCFVPSEYDADFVQTSWSGEGWIYFEIKTSHSVTEFVDAVMNGTSYEENRGSVVDLPETVSSVTTYIGPTDVEVSGSTGSTSAPACAADTVRFVTHTGKGHSLIGCVVPDRELLMRVVKRSGTVDWGGVDILPAGWRVSFDSWTIRDSLVYSTYGMYCGWSVGESGGSHKDVCNCGISASPAVDLDICSATLSGHYTGLCSNSREASYLGTWRTVFLQESFAATWLVDKLLWPGSGETQVAMPNWSWLPPCQSTQTQTPGASESCFTGTKLIIKSNATRGYICGKQQGVDWNWGKESGYSYEAQLNKLEPDFEYNASEQVGAAVDPTWGGVKWSWKTPKMRRVQVYMRGLGYQTDRLVYYNICEDVETSFIQDKAERRVQADAWVYEQRSCTLEPTWPTSCNTDGSGSTPLESHTVHSAEIDKFTLEGNRLTMNGRANNDALAVLELWSTHPGGWQDTGVEPPAMTYTLGMHSAAREEDALTSSEWAEGRVNCDTSGWLLEYFERLAASAPSPYDDLETFIGALAGNQMEFRYLTSGI